MMYVCVCICACGCPFACVRVCHVPMRACDCISVYVIETGIFCYAEISKHLIIQRKNCSYPSRLETLVGTVARSLYELLIVSDCQSAYRFILSQLLLYRILLYPVLLYSKVVNSSKEL